jgi:hypothetical protein
MARFHVLLRAGRWRRHISQCWIIYDGDVEIISKKSACHFFPNVHLTARDGVIQHTWHRRQRSKKRSEMFLHGYRLNVLSERVKIFCSITVRSQSVGLTAFGSFPSIISTSSALFQETMISGQSIPASIRQEKGICRLADHSMVIYLDWSWSEALRCTNYD